MNRWTSIEKHDSLVQKGRELEKENTTSSVEKTSLRTHNEKRGIQQDRETTRQGPTGRGEAEEMLEGQSTERKESSK